MTILFQARRKFLSEKEVRGENHIFQFATLHKKYHSLTSKWESFQHKLLLLSPEFLFFTGKELICIRILPTVCSIMSRKTKIKGKNVSFCCILYAKRLKLYLQIYINCIYVMQTLQCQNKYEPSSFLLIEQSLVHEPLHCCVKISTYYLFCCIV